jgi:protease I
MLYSYRAVIHPISCVLMKMRSALPENFMNGRKPVFAICYAAQLLITADVLRGRKVTGWKSIVQDIKNAGAECIDADVVEDSNLVSSRGPPDIPAFIKAALRKLSSR